MNAIKDALKHRDKIKIEYFKTLLGELSKRDAKGLDELQYSYLKENNRKTNEF
ncbi:MAG: hypothetical protein ORN26_01760 [Candidatus Pacebacteria bacterium]|nr:hypothetical protein [Candidatus Paceibacterota bacterium]